MVVEDNVLLAVVAQELVEVELEQHKVILELQEQQILVEVVVLVVEPQDLAHLHLFMQVVMVDQV